MGNTPESGSVPLEPNKTAWVIPDRSEYGKAWIITSRVIQFLIEEFPTPSDWLFPLIMIINKAIRAWFDPSQKDHWIDIQGYAQLVIDEMQRRNEHGR